MERFAILISIFWLLLSVDGSAQSIIVDQEFTSANHGASGGTSNLAQTWTVGISGTLNQIDLFVQELNGVTFEIRDTNLGVPGSGLLASVALSDVPQGVTQEINIDLSAFNIGLQAGQEFAFILRGDKNVALTYESEAQQPKYAGGMAFSSAPGPSVPTTPIADFGGADILFRSSVAVPEPIETTILVSLVLGLMAAFRRKKYDAH